MKDCEICGEAITEVRTAESPATRAEIDGALAVAGFGWFDLCWPCTNGLGEQRAMAPSTFTINAEWSFVGFESGAKGHAVPASLASGVIDDLRGRGETVATSKVITTLGIDRGGMAFVGRPWVDVVLDGLTLSVACDCFDAFLDRLAKLVRRTLPDGTPYYKLHGHWSCLVLTPWQRERLIDLWRALQPEAARRDHEFGEQMDKKLGLRAAVA